MTLLTCRRKSPAYITDKQLRFSSWKIYRLRIDRRKGKHKDKTESLLSANFQRLWDFEGKNEPPKPALQLPSGLYRCWMPPILLQTPQSRRCPDIFSSASGWVVMDWLKKNHCPTCPWFRSWKTAVPSVSGRTTTARAGTRARWQVLHSVTSAVLPLRHRSWKSLERNCWAQVERVLPENRQKTQTKWTLGRADASGSKSASSISFTCGAEYSFPEHHWNTPGCTMYAMHLYCPSVS